MLTDQKLRTILRDELRDIAEQTDLLTQVLVVNPALHRLTALTDHQSREAPSISVQHQQPAQRINGQRTSQR
jgi:hypothetical protein